ncbi:MAG: shikimate kinase [Candidatus Coatesbacteria bacterium]
MARPAAELPRNVILTGFMGSGKTTVGRVLARRIGWRFLDLDREVERRAGMSVAAIFRRRGEEAFRAAEYAAIRGLCRRRCRVVAVGGGAPVSARNRAWLRRAGLVVWLRVPAAELVRRLRPGASRPLLAPAHGDCRALARLVKGLLRRRTAAYSRAAVAVSGSGSSARVAARVAARAGLSARAR